MAAPRVTVIGLGLIGGSLARDLSASGCSVTGVDRDAAAVAGALREDAIRSALDPDSGRWAQGLAQQDIVVLALPVERTGGLLRQLTGALPTGVIVTDTASTKRSVMAAAARAGLAGSFVGSHPVAGSHHSGWGASRAGLFEGALTWVCPGSAAPSAVETVERLWERVGARTRRVDAADHDRLLARASHLPQAVASALGAALADEGVGPSALGPGGRDATRLAGSDPELWAGILLDNADEVEQALAALEGELARARAALRDRDRDALQSLLRRARAWSAEPPLTGAEPPQDPGPAPRQT